ncbi:MAG: LysM peptidoglycan-binding domain-containing protein [Acidobacteria bacterium]|nr:LysM peptidoglycan-binding domain-containing protein [Acidobacteriota bacterium]
MRYAVERGQTLWDIAAEMYGDDRLWADIGMVNDIDDPNDIGEGMIVLPSVLGGKMRLDLIPGASGAFDLALIDEVAFRSGSFQTKLRFEGNLTALSPTGRTLGRDRTGELIRPILCEQRAYLDPRDNLVRLTGGLSEYFEPLAEATAKPAVAPEGHAVEFRFGPMLLDIEVEQLRFRGAIEILGETGRGRF